MITRRATIGLLPAFAACPAAVVRVSADLSGGPCVVPVVLAGAPARMVLDTGTERTILTRASVARRGLGLDDWVGTAMRGVGGKLDEHLNAVVPQLSLGGVEMFQRNPGEPLSLPVTALDLGGLDGLLGGDVLRHFTVVLEQGAVSLLPPGACGPEAVPLSMLRRALPLAPVRLDGVALTALIDTGATTSLINARGLYRLGVSPSRMASDPKVSAIGIGGRFESSQHRFSELRLGRLRVADPALLTLATPEPAFDLVIGLDVLARQRMVLSYAPGALSLGV